jgi:predicted GIY-YIG superfamily endonuclease
MARPTRAIPSFLSNAKCREAKDGALRSLGEGGLDLQNKGLHYVYCLRSENHPKFRYAGYSADLKKRVQDHNEGNNPSTKHYRPLHLEGYVAFREKQRALAFEADLKSGSGHAFAYRRLW